MVVANSFGLKNRVRLGPILVAVTIWGSAAFLTSGLALIPIGIIWLVTYSICASEAHMVSQDAAQFRRRFPFRYFGEVFGDFQHVFCSKDDLADEIVNAIGTALTSKTPVASLQCISITDIDGALRNPDIRDFHMAYAGSTARGTSVTLLLKLSKVGSMISVHWWVMVGGFGDRNKQFTFVAFSPLHIWSWIVPYFRKEYDILSRIRTIHSSDYNDFDIITLVRCLHDAVFEAMTDELERHDIDTSALRVQRMQIMNITVSGGNVKMGNVVQGAMNAMKASVGGAVKS